MITLEHRIKIRGKIYGYNIRVDNLRTDRNYLIEKFYRLSLEKTIYQIYLDIDGFSGSRTKMSGKAGRETKIFIKDIRL